jgi:nucleoside-diphosphate-sugar epimerase
MSHDSNPQFARTSLIVGCGYLGSRLAQRLLADGATVYGTTRSETKARHLASLGIRPMLLSVTQPLTYASLTPALSAESLDVYYMIPPGKIDGSPSTRHVVLGGSAHMVKALKHAAPHRAVMVSSSAVYGQNTAKPVDADTPAEPSSERTQLLIQGEKLWLAAGTHFSVLRLAGTYGPDRVVGLKAVREGSPLLGNPEALLNLIHVDDAVSLLLAMTHSKSTGRIELGCDGHPIPRLEYYTYLANMIGVAPPIPMDSQTAAARLGLNPARLARSSSKALDNQLTCRRTGWQPAVPDFRTGLNNILNKTPTTPPQQQPRTC